MKAQIGKDLTINASAIVQFKGLIQIISINFLKLQVMQRKYPLGGLRPFHMQTARLSLLIENDYYKDKL